MTSKRFSKTVTVSLVALAAATGAAVLGAGSSAAAPDTDGIVGGPVPIPYPNISVPGQKIPGLTVPAIKIEQKVPALKVPAILNPAIKIAQKIPVLKIPGVIHKLPEQGPIETDGS
jgi:hypothetical protein